MALPLVVRDVFRHDVVPCELRLEALRKLLRMQLDVAIHARGETFVDVARVFPDIAVVLDRDAIAALLLEVAPHAVTTEPLPHLATRAQKAQGDARSVVLRLRVRFTVSGGREIRRLDVRDAVCRAT